MGQVSDVQMLSGITELLDCSLQVNHTATPASQHRAIVSLTGVARWAAALWAQGVTLSRTSSPAFG